MGIGDKDLDENIGFDLAMALGYVVSLVGVIGPCKPF
tara:strand:- start:426 stop:536 length:111 start_codon:yes stop_codon:yes gene_type:complete